MNMIIVVLLANSAVWWVIIGQDFQGLFNLSGLIFSHKYKISLNINEGKKGQK